MKSTSDPFVGTWELDPETLDYEHGRPGRRAVYKIEPGQEGLNFVLDCDDADGRPLSIAYGGLLDGSDQPLPGTNAVLVLTRLDRLTIESAVKRSGKIVDRWTREILCDLDTMRITQHGFKPDGRPFRNVGLYRRRKEKALRRPARSKK